MQDKPFLCEPSFVFNGINIIKMLDNPLHGYAWYKKTDSFFRSVIKKNAFGNPFLSLLLKRILQRKIRSYSDVTRFLMLL